MSEKVDYLIDIVELHKVNLKPGDVLIVKIISDDLDVDQLESLKDSLSRIFVDNKVAIFNMPKGDDIKFEVIGGGNPASQD